MYCHLLAAAYITCAAGGAAAGGGVPAAAAVYVVVCITLLTTRCDRQSGTEPKTHSSRERLFYRSTKAARFKKIVFHYNHY